MYNQALFKSLSEMVHILPCQPTQIQPPRICKSGEIGGQRIRTRLNSFIQLLTNRMKRTLRVHKEQLYFLFATTRKLARLLRYQPRTQSSVGALSEISTPLTPI